MLTLQATIRTRDLGSRLSACARLNRRDVIKGIRTSLWRNSSTRLHWIFCPGFSSPTRERTWERGWPLWTSLEELKLLQLQVFGCMCWSEVSYTTQITLEPSPDVKYLILILRRVFSSPLNKSRSQPGVGDFTRAGINFSDHATFQTRCCARVKFQKFKV